MVYDFDSTQFQAAGFPLDNEAAMWFWALALRVAIFGWHVDGFTEGDPANEVYDDFMFEAGMPSDATRPVGDIYLTKAVV